MVVAIWLAFLNRKTHASKLGYEEAENLKFLKVDISDSIEFIPRTRKT
jgi:hypothetical protein